MAGHNSVLLHLQLLHIILVAYTCIHLLFFILCICAARLVFLMLLINSGLMRLQISFNGRLYIFFVY